VSDAAPQQDAPRRPVLSVIVACLNAADTLGVQLDALAGQPCPVAWELLICDNGSTDATVALARSYADRIPDLRVLDASAHRGAGPARNFGVASARGDWVAFCDADDRVADDWLAAMCAALAEHRFVAGRFESALLNTGRVLRSRPLQQQDELQASDLAPRLPHAGAGNMGIHRADFLAAGGFDPQIRWLEDTDFSWRAQLAGVPLVFRPEVLIHVRLRSTFRSMYRQGRQYGLAQALLEERYGRPEAVEAVEATEAVEVVGAVEATGPAGPVPPAPHPGLLARSRWTVTWLIDHLIAGRLFWRAGWVVGHRSHTPGDLGPAPQPMESSAA